MCWWLTLNKTWREEVEQESAGGFHRTAINAPFPHPHRHAFSHQASLQTAFSPLESPEAALIDLDEEARGNGCKLKTIFFQDVRSPCGCRVSRQKRTTTNPMRLSLCAQRVLSIPIVYRFFRPPLVYHKYKTQTSC